MTDIKLIRDLQAESIRLHFLLGALLGALDAISITDPATHAAILKQLTDKKSRATAPDHAQWVQTLISAISGDTPITTATPPKMPPLRLVTPQNTAPTTTAADSATQTHRPGAPDAPPHNDDEH